MSMLEQRYREVEERVACAARRAGRDPGDVRVIAVSKTVGPDVVEEALECGIKEFGENRPDQLILKSGAYPQAVWHFIGNIQSRRIKDIVGRAALIHSVDRLDIMSKLDKAAGQKGVVQPVLLEVNVSGEQSKSGFAPSQVPEALETISEYGNLLVKGFMTMAPHVEDDSVRKTFQGLRELEDEMCLRFKGGNIDLTELSMGMSEDFETAVEEGATMVRVGRSIFSADFAELR